MAAHKKPHTPLTPTKAATATSPHHAAIKHHVATIKQYIETQAQIAQHRALTLADLLAGGLPPSAQDHVAALLRYLHPIQDILFKTILAGNHLRRPGRRGPTSSAEQALSALQLDIFQFPVDATPDHLQAAAKEFRSRFAALPVRVAPFVLCVECGTSIDNRTRSSKRFCTDACRKRYSRT